MKMYQITPVTNLAGTCIAPASKPETQRALIIAALADGVSTIRHALYCTETQAMMDACQSIGARIIHHPEYIEVHGNSGKLAYDNKVMDCNGSGLVFRTLCALATTSDRPMILTGDDILQKRVMQPLYDALTQLGAHIEKIQPDRQAPIVNWGGGLQGGVCEIPAGISSQFITAVLVVAPLAKSAVTIRLSGELVSKSYVLQTIAMMEQAGITIRCNAAFDEIIIEPGTYRAFDFTLSGDYTSASYLLAAATLYKSAITIKNLTPHSLQGERKIIDFIQAMGLSVVYDQAAQSVQVTNPHAVIKGDFHFDVTDSPNILPTLAAMGAFVEGTFKVTGGRITQLHKSPRIEAVIQEFSALGVDIKPIYRQDVLDGFEIQGNSTYAGGMPLASWQDHRIFMSLFVASLRMQVPNSVEYADVECSFPTFFDEFSKLMVFKNNFVNAS